MYLNDLLNDGLDELLEEKIFALEHLRTALCEERYRIFARRFNRGLRDSCRSHYRWWLRVERNAFDFRHALGLPHGVIVRACEDTWTQIFDFRSPLNIARGYYPANTLDQVELDVHNLLWNEAHGFLLGDPVLRLIV